MTNSATLEAFALVGHRLSQENSATARALMSLAEIEDLDGERSYMVLPLGLEVSEDAAGLVEAVFLHSAGHEGFQAFPFALKGLTFSSTRAEVQETLGIPLRSGVGQTGPWDVYEQYERIIHFMYHLEPQSLSLVTLTAGFT